MENIVKLVGAALIIISGTLLGWIFSFFYTNRVKELENLKTAFIFLKNEINLNHTRLSRSLMLAGGKVKKPISILFLKAAEKLNGDPGREFKEIWNNVLESLQNSTNLLEEDFEILLEWGSEVESTSLEGQLNIHQATINKLEINLENARDIADKKVKLSRYTGTLLSLLIIILFY